jgi:hypothetical protein
MPLSQAQADVRIDSRHEPPMGLASTERARQRREALEDNRRLAEENARLVEENYALREAAAMWIRLYEKQLARANEAASSRARAAELSRR